MSKKQRITWLVYILVTSSLIIINYTTSPQVYWSFVPAVALLFAPYGASYRSIKNKTARASIGALVLIVLLVGINKIFSPSTSWFVFAIAPLLLWPLAAALKTKFSSLPFAVIGSGLLAFYYAIINYTMFTGHPYIVYIVFGLAWWPLFMWLKASRNIKLFSLIAAVLLIAFFMITNHITTPDHQWAIYTLPSFIILPSLAYTLFDKDNNGEKTA